MPRAISTHSNPTTDELQSSEDGGPVVDVRDFHFQLPSRPQSLRPDEESQHVETYRICNLEELQSATTDDSDGASSEVDFTPEGSTDEDDETSLASREDQAVGRSLPSSPREIADYYEAITRGNIEAVKVHLSKGACVNRKTHNGYTPLVIAIVECQLEMAQFLLENHASVHQRVNKLAPIVYATKKSSLTKQFIQLLLDYGALPSTPFGPYYYNALHSATSNGNIDAVDLLICRGMDVESQCDEGRTAFHIATECGETMIVKLLLAKGANINHRNHNGNTALVMAVENGHTETVNLLVKEGLGVNDSNNKEQTPLWIATNRGHIANVDCLLQYGANVNTFSSGQVAPTPAMVAAVTGHVDVLQKLIDNGADLSIVNGWGNTALMLSSIGRIRQDVVKVLLKAMYGPDYPQAFVALEIAKARSSEDLMSLMNVTGLLQPSQGSSEASLRETVYIEVIGQILRQGGPLLRSHILSSLMSTALYEPDTTMVKALFKNGFGSKQLIVTGQTPLYVAISRQHLGLIDALLQGGADPAMFSSVGARFTPLHLALRIFDNTKWKDTSIITSLLETGRCKLMKGADIHATAFSYALTHFDPWPSHLGRNLIFRMLESIEDIQEDRSDDGSTLMHAAVYHGREDLIAVLRSRGADIDAVDNAGCTPFYLECKRSTELLTSLWMRHANERHIGPDGQSALHMAVSGGRMDVIDYLLDLDLYIDHVDDNGYTPFAWAMILGQEDAALHLLSRGATLPTNKFRRGRQLLHISSSQGMLRITKRLLAGKFDIDARDDMGWTPLALACRKGSPELISVLLNAWANPEASPNNTFDRPLHLALRADNVEQADSAEVARVLIERGGADINARGEQGQTPLHLVAQLGDINLFQLLIDDYCEVQTLDDSGRTALHLCSHPDIASSLITHRCDPNHPDTNGWTPAHYAVASENLPVLRVLLLNGADPYARTKDDGLNVMERIEEVLDGEIKREMEEATKAIKLERKGC